jgi:hypothetical protein
MQLMHYGETPIKTSRITGRPWVELQAGGKSIMAAGRMTIFASFYITLFIVGMKAHYK